MKQILSKEWLAGGVFMFSALSLIAGSVHAQTAATSPSDYTVDVTNGQKAIKSDPVTADLAAKVKSAENDNGSVEEETVDVTETIEPNEAVEPAEAPEASETEGSTEEKSTDESSADSEKSSTDESKTSTSDTEGTKSND